MSIARLLTVASMGALGGCLTASYDNPTDDGQNPTLSIQREGTSAFVAASDPAMSTGDYGCPLGSTQDPSFDQFVMVEPGSQLTVGASDADGIRSILVTLTSLHSPPMISNIDVLGLAEGSVQPVVLPGGIGDSLTQVRVNFDQLDPGTNRQTRTVAFDIDFEEHFRVVTTATDANYDTTTLPNDGAPGSPTIILVGDLSDCLN